MNIESEIRSINERLDAIYKFIESDREESKEHIKTAQGFRDRVIILEQTTRSHTQEHLFYRWLFGIVITVGLALLAK